MVVCTKRDVTCDTIHHTFLNITCITASSPMKLYNRKVDSHAFLKQYILIVEKIKIFQYETFGSYERE